MLYYPRKGSLVYEHEFGYQKVGEYHRIEDVYRNMSYAFVKHKNVETLEIFCAGCSDNVEARLTNGAEIYPHRPDLARMPFWKCDECGAFVGTHNKTRDHLKPLGFLATPEIKRWRMRIHDLLDPMWEEGLIDRGKLYAQLSKALGHTYHTGELTNVEEAEFIYGIVMDIRKNLKPGPWNR